jgi:hypothetical protein
LSVVAAKLAAYFTIRRATAEISELARERDEARSAVQAARRAKDELLALLASSERKLPARSTSSGAIEELERRIQVQAQRLDDLLGQARVESGELCQNLRAVSSALAGEDPSSPDSRTRSGQG